MKNKQIDHIRRIMLNVTVFLRKTLPSIFSNAGKIGNVPEFEFANSRRSLLFADNINVTFIS